MASKTVTVGSAVGLHARPAGLIADRAAELGSDLFIGTPDDEPVDASSALMIMTLGAAQGDQVVVSGEEKAHVEEIAAMVEKDLDA
ncbi:HPr family phosphocarrier protein [Nocardioidaceae bacterium]|nr:HPr family phosphocarrier protein [Nocardioidaceae bacterium]